LALCYRSWRGDGERSEQRRDTVCILKAIKMIPNVPRVAYPWCLGGKPTGDMNPVTKYSEEPSANQTLAEANWEKSIFMHILMKKYSISEMKSLIYDVPSSFTVKHILMLTSLHISLKFYLFHNHKMIRIDLVVYSLHFGHV